MDVNVYMAEVGKAARQASSEMAAVNTALKNKALLACAEALDARREMLIAENQKDLEQGRQNGWILQCWIVLNSLWIELMG